MEKVPCHVRRGSHHPPSRARPPWGWDVFRMVRILGSDTTVAHGADTSAFLMIEQQRTYAPRPTSGDIKPRATGSGEFGVFSRSEDLGNSPGDLTLQEKRAHYNSRFRDQGADQWQLGALQSCSQAWLQPKAIHAEWNGPVALHDSLRPERRPSCSRCNAIPDSYIRTSYGPFQQILVVNRKQEPAVRAAGAAKPTRSMVKVLRCQRRPTTGGTGAVDISILSRAMAAGPNSAMWNGDKMEMLTLPQVRICARDRRRPR
ncbi:hypothetical protein CSOJ01_08504 [Colletotrichum sojae]|uniref:Uncharacterized protein n=1 Tax=Colletotrichum sojae TaxID=2175907 RepID=A0A8H6MSU4_9PEZI|nr:hypothetical protein CSOJ01_08504 [Colletotrichum sojae]